MRIRTVVALVVVVGLFGGAFIATTAAGQSTSATNATPGERLSGVIGVQKAELDGDLETRAFEAGLTAADGNETARAVYAAREAEALESRIEALAARLETLREQRANDSISPGAYQAQVAEIATRQRTLLAVANRTNETVSGLPAERLEERGINATRIKRIQADAARLGGPEVAEIARGIAGEDGEAIGREDSAMDGERAEGPPDGVRDRTNDNETGPPEDNEMERPEDARQDDADPMAPARPEDTQPSNNETAEGPVDGPADPATAEEDKEATSERAANGMNNREDTDEGPSADRGGPS